MSNWFSRNYNSKWTIPCLTAGVIPCSYAFHYASQGKWVPAAVAGAITVAVVAAPPVLDRYGFDLAPTRPPDNNGKAPEKERVSGGAAGPETSETSPQDPHEPT